MAMIELSVIIPTYNELEDSRLIRSLACYPQDPRIEYLWVDFNTEEKVRNQIQRQDFIFIDVPHSNRAQRLAKGLSEAKAELILFHHPRSVLDPQGISYLLNLENKKSWGGFTHSFDQTSLMLRWTSWYSNQIRPKLFKIIYLDHCLFFHRSFMDQPLPEIPIFEDTALSEILRKKKRPLILPFVSVTSAIRFSKQGFWKQALLNQFVKVLYHCGMNPVQINRFYEKKIRLNGVN